jgi:hypothetical protein
MRPDPRARPRARSQQTIQSMENLAILGGLLEVASARRD